MQISNDGIVIFAALALAAFGVFCIVYLIIVGSVLKLTGEKYLRTKTACASIAIILAAWFSPWSFY